MNSHLAASRHKKPNFIFRALVYLVLALAATAFEGACVISTKAQPALSQPMIMQWRFQSDRTSNLTPASDGKTVYLPLAEGVLVALNPADGKLIWKAEAGGEFSAAPAVDDRCVYVATQYAETDRADVHGTLRAISKATGVTLWMRTLPGPLRGGLIAGAGALFSGSADGRVYAFNKQSGLSLWINEYREAFSSQPALAGSLVYIGSERGTLLALDQSTGGLKWQYHALAGIQGQIAIANGTVFFGSADGYVYAFSESRSKLVWRRRTGAAVQAVAAVENGLLAASLDNFAYLLSFRKGALVWRRQLPGRISSRPITASDGALFTPLSTDSAIVLGLRDGKPVNTLALGEDNSSSAAPITVGDLVLITTPHGLQAFASPQKNH
jgi:eukaryotic-like serine/threonine-protein kinase